MHCLPFPGWSIVLYSEGHFEDVFETAAVSTARVAKGAKL